MKPEEVAEEHRKFLNVSPNPRISTAAVFKLLSDGMMDIKERLVRIETRQEIFCDNNEKTSTRVDELDNELHDHITLGTGQSATIDERFKWQEKMQKAIMALLVFVIALILTLQFGIGFPIP